LRKKYIYGILGTARRKSGEKSFPEKEIKLPLKSRRRRCWKILRAATRFVA